MKKLVVLSAVLLSLFLLAAGLTAPADEPVFPVQINEENFPDEAFRNFVQSCDRDRDGFLSAPEAYSETKLYLTGKPITDLTGISYFVEMTDLKCSNLPLGSLDLSWNTKLQRVECKECQLTSLNVRNCDLLLELDCSQNQLETLDVSDSWRLRRLLCGSNPLRALDITHNIELHDLYCWTANITSLDLTKNKQLRGLYCSKNQLTELDLSANPLLTQLYSDDNALQRIIVSACTELERIYAANNQLAELDVGGLANLKVLDCSNNSLSALDISTNVKLTVFYCDRNRLTSLDCTNNQKLYSLDCSDNQLKALRFVPGLRNVLNTVKCKNNRLTSLDLGWAPELRQLLCSGNPIPILNVKYYDTLNQLVMQKPAADQYIDYQTFVIEGFGWHGDVGNNTWLLIDKRMKVLTTGGMVIPAPVTEIALNRTAATLTRTLKNKKPTLQLSVEFTPEDATDRTLEWSSSDPSVAKVNAKGLVTALKAGECVITCETKDGSHLSASCTVTVKNKLVKKLVLNVKKATLKTGKTLQLKVKTVKPADALNQKVKWTSSDKKVATVDKKGKVKAKRKGTCIITCTALDGSGVSAECRITVK